MERERAEGLKMLVDRETILASEQASLLRKWTENWTQEHTAHNSRVSELRVQARQLEEELENCRKTRQEVGLNVVTASTQEIGTVFKKTVDSLRSMAHVSTKKSDVPVLSSDLVDDLIARCLQLVNLSQVSLDGLSATGTFDEIATALCVICGVRETPYVTTMESFLSVNQPALMKHAALVCWTFAGHEAEFGDSIIMRSLGKRALDARTWIHVPNDDFYFSALSGLCQRSRPALDGIEEHIAYGWSCDAPSTFLEPNPSPAESTAGHRTLLRANITAHFIKKEPLMLDRIPLLLKSYAFRELELWELLQSRRAKV
ncbi:Hypothetical protein, putative [Bodo saltans]|uniref:Uncharacterized protein n=1 Tax=Bodo saltans TaxID=75058 RepID=A0A0S4IL09_BODSA|nr:Hypothetical protein, putative [Bodo saltans]|eukprot:CUE69773.1 Hypothetical protein, putative [Bodo saltans]